MPLVGVQLHSVWPGPVIYCQGSKKTKEQGLDWKKERWKEKRFSFQKGTSKGVLGLGRLLCHLKLREAFFYKNHTQWNSVIRYKLAFPKWFWLVLLLTCHVVVKTIANVNRNLNGINCCEVERAEALQVVEISVCICLLIR